MGKVEAVANTEQVAGTTTQEKRSPTDAQIQARFKPGQSGNPNGMVKGTRHMGALRAFADAKPNGSDKTNLEALIAAVFKRAMGGSSRHAQLIFDRLIPHKSIKVTEDTRTVNVLMQIAVPPEQWKQPVIDVDASEQPSLGTDSSEDV